MITSLFHRLTSQVTALRQSHIEETGVTPYTLLRLLDVDEPALRLLIEDPQPSIGISSVVAWHIWENTQGSFPSGQMTGWTYSNGYYDKYTKSVDALASIGKSEEEADWRCDIQDVTGFATSKSKLADFASMDAMVETNSREMIDNKVNLAGLRENLAHKEIPSDDLRFTRFLWDSQQKTYLNNSGGSHHFAAARFIANKIEEQVPLKGTLSIHSLNEGAVNDLLDHYDLYVLPSEEKLGFQFFEAMRAFRTTYFFCGMPGQGSATQVILLPKNEERSVHVSSILRQAGLYELGPHLKELCARQKNWTPAPRNAPQVVPATPSHPTKKNILHFSHT